MRETIKTIMYGENAASYPLMRFFLYLISKAYAAATRLRSRGYQRGILKSKQLPCKVISFGNLTLGGTGKTPLTLYCAGQLASKGNRVVVLSRGYRAVAEKDGAVVSDGDRLLLNPRQAGDEPFMMAARLKKFHIPVVIGKDRYKMGMLAADRFRPDVILCDDAYQHLKLRRDINFMLLDSRRPFGNSHIFPRGTLREPKSAIQRADGLIVTRSETADGVIHRDLRAVLDQLGYVKPTFVTCHVPYICRKVRTGVAMENVDVSAPVSSNDSILAGKSVFAFAGIARNDEFKKTIEEMGGRLRGFVEYPDHHYYTVKDLQQIVSAALNAGAELLVTTEKDSVKIEHGFKAPLDLVVVGVGIDFGIDALRFLSFIQEKLKR